MCKCIRACVLTEARGGRHTPSSITSYYSLEAGAPTYPGPRLAASKAKHLSISTPTALRAEVIDM